MGKSIGIRHECEVSCGGRPESNPVRKEMVVVCSNHHAKTCAIGGGVFVARHILPASHTPRVSRRLMNMFLATCRGPQVVSFWVPHVVGRKLRTFECQMWWSASCEILRATCRGSRAFECHISWALRGRFLSEVILMKGALGDSRNRTQSDRSAF